MKSQQSLVAYLAIPIKFHNESMVIQSRLEADGIIVKNPCQLIEPGLPKEKIPGFYADSSYELIESADFLVLYADYYGRDVSTEVGYAIRNRKPVFPFSYEGRESDNLIRDFMIYAKVEPLSKSFEDLTHRILLYFS